MRSAAHGHLGRAFFVCGGVFEPGRKTGNAAECRAAPWNGRFFIKGISLLCFAYKQSMADSQAERRMPLCFFHGQEGVPALLPHLTMCGGASSGGVPSPRRTIIDGATDERRRPEGRPPYGRLSYPMRNPNGLPRQCAHWLAMTRVGERCHSETVTDVTVVGIRPPKAENPGHRPFI